MAVERNPPTRPWRGTIAPLGGDRQRFPAGASSGEGQERIRQLVEAAGARLLFLPPYSPDLNPIELVWARLKGALKDFGARTRDALDIAIRRGMDLIRADDARAWFTHCGYKLMGSDQRRR